jgi:hypothetical protein
MNYAQVHYFLCPSLNTSTLAPSTLKPSLEIDIKLCSTSSTVLDSLHIIFFLLSSNQLCLVTMSYGHTHQNLPHPVRSAKSSWWWFGQYCGGGPHGNTECCSFLALALFLQICTRTKDHVLGVLGFYTLSCACGESRTNDSRIAPYMPTGVMQLHYSFIQSPLHFLY